MTPIEFRRHLHSAPELSFKEFRTAEFIEQALREEGIECRRIANTGVLATIAGRGDVSRAVVLRADIDALPVVEATDLPYASQVEGVMHACGHDMHAAVLFGVLQRLSRARNFEGTVLGLFQPGEECNPGGASFVLSEEPFAGYNVVAVIGEHVDSGLEVGEFGFCEGAFMASSDELRLTVKGRGGHAAMRDKIVDPVVAAAHLVARFNALNEPSSVVSIGRFIAEGATNVIPDEVKLEGTMRTFSEQWRESAHKTMAAHVAEVDAQWGTTTTLDISRGYPSVNNDSALTQLAVALANEHFKAQSLPRRTTAEDFGFYTQRYPSLFYRLGVGAAAGRSHSSTFSPDEAAIEVGVDFMYRLTHKVIEYGQEKG